MLTAAAKIFQPVRWIQRLPGAWEAYVEHFGTNDFDRINEAVYGGAALDELFGSVVFRASDEDLAERRCTIELVPADGSPVGGLTLWRVSMRQLLVAGLVRPETVEPDWRRDAWDELDEQYKLELCHAESSRWSVFFKREGELIGLDPADAPGHEPFARIELVNNCTTAWGFEARVEYEGVVYHGSFGRGGALDALYAPLSQQQAATWAQQTRPLGPALPAFGWGEGTVFGACNGWGPGHGDGPVDLRLDLERYRHGARVTGERTLAIEPNRGRIDYARWGRDGEVYQKSQVRKLVLAVGDERRPEPPATYAEVQGAPSITLPSFAETGVYEVHEEGARRCYPWLAGLDTCVVRALDNGLVELELRRAPSGEGVELRSILLGNVDLGAVPAYPEGWTLDRFGYGPRTTSPLLYDPDFVPPHGGPGPAPYGFLLAGTKKDEPRTYVCPEPFGIERAVLSYAEPGKLAVDLISFERILPVWQGTVSLASATT